MIRHAVASSLALLCLAGCSGTTHTASSGVTGIVRGYGGPAVLVHGKPRMAIDGSPMKATKVTATGTTGVVETVTTNANGRFTMSLAPGRYSLRPSCGEVLQVTVRSRQSSNVVLRCDFP